MDENRLSGTARNVGGKIEEGMGNLAGDAKTQIQGKLDQATGAVQDLYGQIADAAPEAGWFRKVASHHHRDAALYRHHDSPWHRLATRPNAPAVMINSHDRRIRRS
jgi:uncharacterized protein YjbJ (UPF0337 family)